MQYNNDTITDLFSYHPATPETTAKYKAVNDAIIELAYLVNDLTAPGENKQNAMFQLNIARMAINLAITHDVVLEHKMNELYASEEHLAQESAKHGPHP